MDNKSLTGNDLIANLLKASGQAWNNVPSPAGIGMSLMTSLLNDPNAHASFNEGVHKELEKQGREAIKNQLNPQTQVVTTDPASAQTATAQPADQSITAQPQNPYTPGDIYSGGGRSKGSNILQTLLTIASAGMIPTSGYANTRANSITGVKAGEAANVPLTQAEQATLQAGDYTAQTQALKEQLDSVDKTRQTMVQQMNNIVAHPIWNAAFGGPDIGTIKKQVEVLNSNFDKIQSKLTNLVATRGQQAAKLPSQSQAPKGAKGWDTTKGRWVY